MRKIRKQSFSDTILNIAYLIEKLPIKTLPMQKLAFISVFAFSYQNVPSIVVA